MKPHSLTLFHDVFGDGCYIVAHRLKQIQAYYGSKILLQYQLCSLAPTLDDFKQTLNVLDTGKVEFMGLPVSADRELADVTLEPDFIAPENHAHRYLLPVFRGLKAAELQGGMKAHGRLYDRLYKAYRHELRPILEPETIIACAMEIGLDKANFQASFESHASLVAVMGDRLSAQMMGIRGVPTVVINRRWLIPGVASAAIYKRIIDDLLAGHFPNR